MRWNISCRQSSWIILCFVNSIAGEKNAFNRILGRETAKTFSLTCLCLDYITKDTVEDEHYCLFMRYYYFMHRWISYSCRRRRSLYYIIKITSPVQDQLSITICFIIYLRHSFAIVISKPTIIIQFCYLQLNLQIKFLRGYGNRLQEYLKF